MAGVAASLDGAEDFNYWASGGVDPGLPVAASLDGAEDFNLTLSALAALVLTGSSVARRR